MYRLSQLVGQSSRHLLAALWTEVTGREDAQSIDMNSLHQYFTAKFGKDKSSKAGSVVDRAVAKIIERSGGGLKGLQRCCQNCCPNEIYLLGCVQDNGHHG